MSELRGIKQNKETKQKYNHPIIDLLLTDEPSVKEDLMEKLHITNERTLREIIAICSMHYPIIAVSSKKGYRRAKDIDKMSDEELEEEIAEVDHQLAEHKSRVACIKKKMKPLVAWKKVAEKRLANNGNN